MVPATNSFGGQWNLPPLILHPFSDTKSPDKLVQSSRASLILQGLLPREDQNIEDLQQVLLDGRYCEIRMLYYIGKDTERWIEQCLEYIAREPALRASSMDWQTFATLLVEDPPSLVLEKLKKWGVVDHQAIFSRGLALNCMFAEAPPRDLLTNAFIRNYHQYADQIYACRLRASTYGRVASKQFDFQLFASGEYARMLESQWAEQ